MARRPLNKKRILLGSSQMINIVEEQGAIGTYHSGNTVDSV
jgi:hypothetical protein